MTRVAGRTLTLQEFRNETHNLSGRVTIVVSVSGQYYHIDDLYRHSSEDEIELEIGLIDRFVYGICTNCGGDLESEYPNTGDEWREDEDGEVEQDRPGLVGRLLRWLRRRGRDRTQQPQVS